jgi:17beta-estradiol 17-dehydrogenase / very-long-chain 3-oxoacyl-CoA reductase
LKISIKHFLFVCAEPISIYENIENILSELDVGVLINNVGMAYPMPQYFHELEPSLIMDMISCNVVSCTKMTAICLPGMIRNKRGLIINNGSLSGRIPLPLEAVYSATKAYMDFFSRALNAEYAKTGIIVQSLCAFFVATKMVRMTEPTWWMPSASDFVKSALKTQSTQSISSGCLLHNILVIIRFFFKRLF